MTAKYKEPDPLTQKWAGMMQYEMDANASKGTDDEWIQCHHESLWVELQYHSLKLLKAMRENNLELVRELSADTANLAFMSLESFERLYASQLVDSVIKRAEKILEEKIEEEKIEDTEFKSPVEVFKRSNY